MSTAITTRDLYVLDEACRPIRRAFSGGRPSGIYLVGSSYLGKEAPRDIDVRLILDDAEFDRLFRGDGPGWYVSLWEMMSLTTAEYLRSRTGLPIDFQIQKASIANEKHDKPRNALGLKGGRIFAGGGDGTDWSEETQL